MIDKKRSLYDYSVRTNYQCEEVYNNNKHIDILRISLYDGVIFDPTKIPKSVNKLMIYSNLNFNINDIPSNIKQLYFYKYNNLLEQLPISIEEISIEKEFNRCVDDLGNNFKIIDFGWDFNQPVDNLPNSLEKLCFGNNFNHPINNLPQKLKVLYIHNYNYNYSLIKKIPSSLIFIEFGTNNNNDYYDIFENIIINKKYVHYLENNKGMDHGYASGSNYLNKYFFISE